MKKLALRLDDLSVESFETVSGRDAAGGTVRGNACTEVSCTDAYTCGIPIGDSTNSPLRGFARTRVDCEPSFDGPCCV